MRELATKAYVQSQGRTMGTLLDPKAGGVNFFNRLKLTGTCMYHEVH